MKDKTKYTEKGAQQKAHEKDRSTLSGQQVGQFEHRSSRAGVAADSETHLAFHKMRSESPHEWELLAQSVLRATIFSENQELDSNVAMKHIDDRLNHRVTREGHERFSGREAERVQPEFHVVGRELGDVREQCQDVVNRGAVRQATQQRHMGAHVHQRQVLAIRAVRDGRERRWRRQQRWSGRFGLQHRPARFTGLAAGLGGHTSVPPTRSVSKDTAPMLLTSSAEHFSTSM